MESKLFYLILSLPAFVAALTLHEFAHAWAANRLGDDTPRRMGRLTLDPLAHLDPFGTLIWVVAAMVGAPLLAWAKPVPFNPRNLDHPRRDAILIAIAGPISNLIQLPIWFLAFWGFHFITSRAHTPIDLDAFAGLLGRDPLVAMPSGATIVAAVLAQGIIFNMLLAAFNMIPLPPLDGHYVLEGLGPPFIADFFNTIRPYSFFLLFMLIQTPYLSMAIAPFMMFAYNLIFFALGHPA